MPLYINSDSACNCIKRDSSTGVFLEIRQNEHLSYRAPPIDCFCMMGTMILNEVDPRSGPHDEFDKKNLFLRRLKNPQI